MLINLKHFHCLILFSGHFGSNTEKVKNVLMNLMNFWKKFLQPWTRNSNKLHRFWQIIVAHCTKFHFKHHHNNDFSQQATTIKFKMRDFCNFDKVLITPNSNRKRTNRVRISHGTFVIQEIYDNNWGTHDEKNSTTKMQQNLRTNQNEKSFEFRQKMKKINRILWTGSVTTLKSKTKLNKEMRKKNWGKIWFSFPSKIKNTSH